MTDKKLTDNEIIKALECCSNDKPCSENKCPFYESACENDLHAVEKYALDLINRLQAENERLLQKTQRPQDADPMDFCGVLCDFSEGLIAKAKAEAYKEFAERLKNKLTSCSRTIDGKSEYLICDSDIDNLLKEMVGE